jgi:hypothetical protein
METVNIPTTEKKLALRNHKWRQWSSFSSMSRVFFPFNSFHKTKDWIIHNDNSTAHKALSVKKFLSQKSITEMDHPPYFIFRAPNGFWQLPEIKSALKERRFQATEDNKKNVTTALEVISQQEFGSIVGLSTQLPKRSTSMTSSVSCKYTGMLAIKSFRKLHSHTL